MLDKLQRAIAQPSRATIRSADTDALRIVDGTGDGFNDLAIDDFAGNWLVETKGDFPEWLRNIKHRGTEDTEKHREEKNPDHPSVTLCASVFKNPSSIYWKRLGDKESPRWVSGIRQEEPFVVSENGVKYWIDFASGYSQGIFLDQRDNRLALRQMARGKTVLNTFAYTCAFGVCAALGGAAEMVNLDLSKRYLEWGRRNYALNPASSGRSGAPEVAGGTTPGQARHDFIFGDVADWLKRFRKKGRKFDIILLDPPTFSRNEKGAIFTIEDGFTALVGQAVALLNAGGTLFCSTNQRSMNASEFRRLITDGIEDLENWELRFAPMPADFTGEDYLKTWWVERAG
jgi:23S rRNA (cytosine1962-C5)-methyltransferase